MREQINRAVKLFGPVLALGFGYLVLYTLFGLRIPCMIHTVTGLYCPGCGVSRMCAALFHLDFVTAFWCNPGIMVLMPLFGLALLPGVVAYIKTGIWKSWKGERAALYCIAVLLLVYAVLRNLPAFWFLRPHG